MFLKFRLDTHRLFEELGRHTKGGGLQECSNCGACKESVENVFWNVHRMIPRIKRGGTQRQNTGSYAVYGQ